MLNIIEGKTHRLENALNGSFLHKISIIKR